jgi:phenylpyruvate tautomerase PptA (4-oxalocrotonate tautomerase family)
MYQKGVKSVSKEKKSASFDIIAKLFNYLCTIIRHKTNKIQVLIPEFERL